MGYRNTKKAAEEFYSFCLKHNYDGFSAQEIRQIMNEEKGEASAIMRALSAGFMYGYKYAKREAKNSEWERKKNIIEKALRDNQEIQ